MAHSLTRRLSDSVRAAAAVETGMLATTAFGLGWWQALAAIVLGGALGAAAIGPIAERHPGLGSLAAAVAFVTAGLVHAALTRNVRPGAASTPHTKEISA
ncbi:purine-cytosine permease-like protein [Nocardia sp. GAS34]|jgi:hypothetical protein|uniref:hypothetical protein n=1 Tax=unclassified Nocardia TaxID=2637762 RepID=UPI003D1C3B68